MIYGSDREWLAAVIRAVPVPQDPRRRQALTENRNGILEHLLARALDPVDESRFWEYSAPNDHQPELAAALVAAGMEPATFKRRMSMREYLRDHPLEDRFELGKFAQTNIRAYRFGRALSPAEAEFEMQLRGLRPATLRETIAVYPEARRRHSDGVDEPYRFIVLGSVARGHSMGMLTDFPILDGDYLDIRAEMVYLPSDWFPTIIL